MYPQTMITTQSKSLIKALRLSYGITASKSQAARAAKLAPTIQRTHPGIYIVGRCQISLFRMGCTCQAARTRKASGQPFKPCAHFLALYLAGEWSPGFNYAVSMESAGIHEPLMIGWECTLAGTRGRFRFVEAYDDWLTLAPLAGGSLTSAPLSDIRQLWPIWESA